MACPKCGKYLPLGAQERLAMVLDEATFVPLFEAVGICDQFAWLNWD